MTAGVLFVAPVGFARLKQRHQAFAVELTRRGFDVMFVEPLQSPGWGVDCRKISPGLNVLSVKVPCKASSFPGLQAIAAKIALSLLLKETAIKKNNTLLWLAEPALAAMTDGNWQTVVYDRCDLHGAFPGQRRCAWQKYEQLLWRRADLISISHPFLASGIPAAACEKTVLVPNACSEEFLRGRCHHQNSTASRSGLSALTCSKADNSADVPDFRSLPQTIRLVSSGAHYEWVDCDWLKMLSEIEGVELHVAGTGRGEGFEQLVRSRNVVFHGLLEHEALHELLLSCHAGLIPFKDLELIRGVDPIKAYEYAACGLEVWAVDLASLRDNPVISRYIRTRSQAELALKSLRRAPEVFSGDIPAWGERLQTILDRTGCLRSN